MNYVYDIILNFQKHFYDFYDWNTDDEITHIRKIPLFHITNKDFKNLKSSVCKFEPEFYEKIYNHTEKFKKINVTFINYVFLVSNGKEALALKLNKDGLCTHKSSLLLDEEEEIADIAEDLKIYNLNYKIIKKGELSFQTRAEKENLDNVANKLGYLYNHKEDEKLKFLYLECFDKTETDINKIFNILTNEIKTDSKNVEKIIDFFKIINQK